MKVKRVTLTSISTAVSQSCRQAPKGEIAPNLSTINPHLKKYNSSTCKITYKKREPRTPRKENMKVLRMMMSMNLIEDQEATRIVQFKEFPSTISNSKILKIKFKMIDLSFQMTLLMMTAQKSKILKRKTLNRWNLTRIALNT